jgi:hypothetical protein
MNTRAVLEREWDYLLCFFPPREDLIATAYAAKAIQRRRAVNAASRLLQFCFAYGVCGLSLRQTATWAEPVNSASLSDVALLKRLRSASVWLGLLLGAKLA